MAQKPIILSHNVFDTTVQYPFAPNAFGGFSDAPGRDFFRATDNLRDMTWWNQLTATLTRGVDVGVATSVDTLIIDRGSTTGGSTISVLGSNTNFLIGSTSTLATHTVPTTAGGTPGSGAGCLTPDGIYWLSFTPGSFRYLWVTASGFGNPPTPIVTGLYLGQSYRFPEYCLAPAALRDRRNATAKVNKVSRGGVRIRSRRLVHRELDIHLEIEGSDYPAFDVEATRLVNLGCPWWFCTDDSDAAQCAKLGLFQLPGDTIYDPQEDPVFRRIDLMLEEVVPVIYT